MVDELVDYSLECDPELADGLRWVDNEAKKRGITFYEMAYRILLKYDAQEKAIAWRKAKI